MTAPAEHGADVRLAALTREVALLRKDVRAVVKVAQIFYSAGGEWRSGARACSRCSAR